MIESLKKTPFSPLFWSKMWLFMTSESHALAHMPKSLLFLEQTGPFPLNWLSVVSIYSYIRWLLWTGTSRMDRIMGKP
jgi:hypothetical protein